MPGACSADGIHHFRKDTDRPGKALKLTASGQAAFNEACSPMMLRRSHCEEPRPHPALPLIAAVPAFHVLANLLDNQEEGVSDRSRGDQITNEIV